MQKLTPMMAQYKKIKEQYYDCILMFRLGDFYEMFFEDAVEASKILQITLTSRNKGAANKAPMCGIPYHAVDQYLPKLTRAGKKVAICDQITEPNGTGIVEREVIRVVTPGTTFDDSILDQKANNFVACVVSCHPHGSGDPNGEDSRLRGNDNFALAYSDVTTGSFYVTMLHGLEDLKSELMRVQPAECICDEDFRESLNEILKNTNKMHVFPYSYHGDSEYDLKKHFEINSLKIFNLEGQNLAVEASAILFSYLKETQKTDLKHIQRISYYEISEFMPLNEACIRNLEFFQTNRGKREGSLIWILDQTVTSMGGRMLRNWLLHPLLDEKKINERLDKVEIFVNNSTLLREMRDTLDKLYDVERLLSRLSLGTGNARDLVAMKKSLEQIPLLRNLILNQKVEENLNNRLHAFEDLVALIDKAIVDEPPAIVREAGMIKNGFHDELDELKTLSTEGKTFIQNLQKREIERTGISSMKVKFNKVFGYYIEISKANLDAVPDDYVRKQTLVNAERFITPELKKYEEKVLSAEDRMKELEYELFYKVRMEVVKEIVGLQETAQALAELDVLSNFAWLSMKNRYCKPVVSDGEDMKIMNGRHPVIEQINLSGDFVPNDCKFDEDHEFLLITGPNMGGKSTYLRQVALIVLMAQMGCYVPADSVQLGVVDRIFTRVGASDNLVAGESTFMVEMQEASYILHNASEKSLIILDEIGRGTSTYDGVSIAWAIMEYIHDEIGAKTLFATHYHELIELGERLKCACNLSVAVRENAKDGVVFLYKIVEGGVDKSYGIEVAKLAGLPVDIIGRARGVLQELETKHIKKSPDDSQIGLFDKEKSPEKADRIHKKIKEDLEKIDINKMTPLEAMQKINELKKSF